MDSCRLLPSDPTRQPDPSVQLFVTEDQVEETVSIKSDRCQKLFSEQNLNQSLKSRNPVFEQGFLVLVPGNLNQAELKVEHSYYVVVVSSQTR